MKRIVKTDPFFADQPEKSFIGELMRPLHREKPYGFGERACLDGEADASGLFFAGSFPDDKGLLRTAYDDFEKFLSLCGAAGDRYPLEMRQGDAGGYEAFTLEVAVDHACLTANDTEGIRRALVWIEGEMTSREGAFLPLGVTRRKPEMTLRLTRCFFSPINRPPKYGDELSDDIDYYPDEYLNRLAHDGANAVWIYTRFSDLVTSPFLPGYGKGAAARIEKLNSVCEKCARYGIRPYVFAIEPVALAEEDSHLLPEADGGTAYNGRHYFCVASGKGNAAVRGMGRKLFEACPGLGGFISITYGERPTSCSSAYAAIPDIGFQTPVVCPRCRGISPGQALANAVRALTDGIREAAPDADVISWTYGHRFWPEEDVREYVRRAPDGAILMQNFEELVYGEQLGKTRCGVDYWLSAPGPSPLFRATAEEARKAGKRMFMKTQVCCSHELATVPYVPVPGILFDRYREAYALGVTGVMQCWYFGNYPSMMSRAAGELSFMSDLPDKRAFLERLAALQWGGSRASRVADAWEAFEEGYRAYPLNIMFSYYGPMHDGVVWDLALNVRDFSLPRSWQTLDPTDGDRIGECLLNGHTLDEAIALSQTMSDAWERGLAILRGLDHPDEAAQEQLSVAEAIGVLFRSGLNILRFYALRDRLGRQEGDARETLHDMRNIVLCEIENSRCMTALCEADARLGYHSEGEGYKYFPEKLRWRVGRLGELLEKEFPEVEARVEQGLPPLAFYAGDAPDYRHYQMRRGDIECAAWEAIGGFKAFRAAYDEKRLVLEWESDAEEPVDVDMEFSLLWPACPVRILPDGRMELSTDAYLYYSAFGEEQERVTRLWRTERLKGEKMRLRATIDRAAAGWTRDDLPIRMRCAIGGKGWLTEEQPIHTLGKTHVSPMEYGFLVTEQNG